VTAEQFFLLGVRALQDGRLDEAIDLLTHASALVPGHAGCLANLGEAERRRGNFHVAIDWLLKAVAADPGLAPALRSLGSALYDCGALDAATACFARAAELQPDAPGSQARLATLRAEAAQGGSAGAPARPIDALAAKVLLTLARPLALAGRIDDAIEHLGRATRHDPALVAAHCNLGMLQAALGRVEDACASYRRALALEPGRADIYHSLGNALLRGGLLEEATAAFRDAVAADPAHASHRSDLIFHLHFHPAHDAPAILAEARKWDAAHGAGLASPGAHAGRDRDPDRRLRIGYVSPNFRRHCQAFFLLPLLEHHDRERFEICCYSDVARPDDWTNRLLACADRVQNVRGASDAELAARIAADGVDILVDLTMHMAENRLGAFARRPAPVQLCWLAYPGTTGLAAMDYRVTDPYLDPPGGDDDADAYAETSLRLPETFWCYDPLTAEPAVGPLPAREHGHVRFGSLNNVLKVSEPVVALWARVLRSVDGATVTLLAPTGDARERTLRWFEAHGVPRHRVQFVEYQSRQTYLETYRTIDVGLDTFPYGGHTTSLDAFWMGVPVVTLVGSTVVGRAGLSQAMNLGLPQLVARGHDEFVRVAVGLAKDLDGLARLRADLRGRMERSPLMDGARFARNLEAAYRSAWRRPP
jgi:protein O-GlcNAc transferase